MNKTYRSVWNESLCAWVAVAEIEGAKRKKSRPLRLSALALGIASVFGGGSVWADDTSYIGAQNQDATKENRKNSYCFKGTSLTVEFCKPWTAEFGFTDVTGGTVAYLTSSNVVVGGGVWAGSKSSGLWFGNGPNAAASKTSGTASFEMNAEGASLFATTIKFSTPTLTPEKMGSPTISFSNNRLSNVGAGVAPDDASTVSQLSSLSTTTSSGIATLSSALSASKSEIAGMRTTTESIDASGTKYFKTKSTGSVATATGNDAVAIGSTAVASFDNSVALGAGSKTFDSVDKLVAKEAYQPKFGAGSLTSATAASEVSIGSPTHKRRLTNVAAGGNPTDAVNVEQLKELDEGAFAMLTKTDGTVALLSTTLSTTNGNVSSLSITTHNIDDFGTKYFKAKSTADPAQANGPEAVAVGPRARAYESNSLAVGSEARAAETFAVAVGPRASALANSSIAIGMQAASMSPQTIAIGPLATSVGTSAVALGRAAVAGGDFSMALGSGASANGGHSIALGANAGSLYPNGVALGANSKTADAFDVSHPAASYSPFQGAVLAGTQPIGEVSIGSLDNERRITNVAAGSASTDAVNISQLSTTASSLSTGLSTTNSNITGVSTSMSTAASSFSTRLSTTNSNITDLTTSLSTTNSSLSATNSNVTSLSTSTSTTAASLSTRLSTTNSNITDLTTSLSTTNSSLSATNSNVTSESPRILWRLNTLRGLSHEEVEQVFT